MAESIEASWGNRWAARAAMWVSHTPGLRNVVAGHGRRVRLLAWDTAYPVHGDATEGAHYNGDPEGTKLPVPWLYKLVGQTAVHGQVLEEWERPANTRPVVWWKLGAVTMWNVLAESEFTEIVDGGQYNMRIGGGPLDTGLAFVETRACALHVPPGLVSAGEVIPFKQLPEGSFTY